MKRNHSIVLALLIILVSLASSRFNIIALEDKENNSVYNLNTGFNYTTIQAAIDAPETLTGHTIFVERGIYYEHLLVNKALHLIGEDRNSTIIDGSSTGHVVSLHSDNVTMSNFTVRNAGRTWDSGFPDSCVVVNSVRDVHLINNTMINATVGMLAFASTGVKMESNAVSNCELMGIHLDGGCTNCTISENFVIANLEGLEIESSHHNIVTGNILARNNVSIVLSRCGGSNVLRRNNITTSQYNLIVFGSTLDSFMQNIDSTNNVDGKTLFYLTNLTEHTLTPNEYQNLGYLAIVNCTGVIVEGFNLASNKDGITIAYSESCTLANLTISQNNGPLLYGGLTFYESYNNTVVNSEISNNSYGVCLYHSNYNTFYLNHINFNGRHVISDFLCPFTDDSSGHISLNYWNLGFQGNYWSDYREKYPNATEFDGSGFWDTPYAIDQFNQDSYPIIPEFPSLLFFSLFIIISLGAILLHEMRDRRKKF